MTIPRFPITRDSMEVFAGKIQGRLDAIGSWQTYAPRWLASRRFSDRSQVATTVIPVPDSIPPPSPTVDTLSQLSDPGPDWVALPWSRSPRWFIPREPPMLTKKGLCVYHPVTIRSRIGWEVGRMLASRGAFRSLRGSGLLPREVWEAASPYIPPGGTLAMARANHPGRFHALVFDAQGRPMILVKVARDTLGAQALATEREALDRYGPFLSSPLIAPELLSHSEGVLVFRAMDWQANPYPWRLPEEVAFAIGAFFSETRSETTGVGAAHGDFAPWNLLRTEKGWGLIDWESFMPVAPPYFDLFHFLIQSTAGLRRPFERTILGGLKGQGWVGEVIEAYSAGSGVKTRDSTHFFREYLRICREMLDPGLAGTRAVEVRSRMSATLGQ